jgi:hypothetical protein
MPISILNALELIIFIDMSWADDLWLTISSHHGPAAGLPVVVSFALSLLTWLDGV